MFGGFTVFLNPASGVTVLLDTSGKTFFAVGTAGTAAGA
jgi:hypothetical protein